MRRGPRPGTIVGDSTTALLEMKVPAHSADRISSCATLLAGVVGGVLVFVVALPLALSSPFPRPRQGEWVIENSTFNEASPARAWPMLPPPTEPVRTVPQTVMAAAGDPGGQPEAITFAERWSPTVPEVAAIATAPSEARPVEVPPEATRLAPPGTGMEPTLRKRSSVSKPDPVDQYLWQVYQRKSVKSDSTGDFTWKDPAAARRLGMSVKTYVIGGMDPDFREQLYHAGRAMDASGIRWSILSAFRDDYRQRLAAGFKAHGGNSQHGGSNATGGYGHGRAVDITCVQGDSAVAWHWIDAHGGQFGLRRPMPGADPAHVQSGSSFHDLARRLREARLKSNNELNGVSAAAGKAKVLAQADEASKGRGVGK